MRTLRNTAFTLLLVTIITSEVSLRAEIFCSPYDPGGGDFGCHCICVPPDSCGGNQNDCEIGGFPDRACRDCFGGGSEAEATMACDELHADFICMVGM